MNEKPLVSCETRDDASDSREIRHFRIRHLIVRPDLVLRAIIALFWARIALKRLRGLDIVTLNSESLSGLPSQDERTGKLNAKRARVAVTIPLIARMVPWRSDCVVQALAARSWLASYGIASEIQVGAKPLPGAAIDAHAWLVSNGTLITGGHSTEYPVLIGSGIKAPRMNDNGTQDAPDTKTFGD